MKFDKKKLKEDLDKILGFTKDNAEKLWEGTLLLVDKGSKQYQILRLQKDIYFIQRKIEKLKHKLGDKVYKLYKKGKLSLNDVKPIGFDIDILLDEIKTIEDDNIFESYIRFYPNPVNNGLLNIEILSETNDNVILKIYDLCSRVVFQKEIQLEKDKTFSDELNLDYLSDGAYFLNLKGKYTNFVDKLVIY